MTRPIITERATFAGIPSLHVRRRDLPAGAPTIIFYHGWSSKKERHVIFAEALAIDGLRVILPDAPLHGERDALPEYQSREAWDQYWPLVRRAIGEADAIKNDLVASGLADPGRLAIGGNSMGGMIASGAMATYPWIKAGAFSCSSLSHVWLDEQTRLFRGERPATAEERQLLTTHDPEGLIDRIAPRPVLLLHGTEDRVLPIANSRRFVERARPAYAATPERLHLEEFPGIEHVTVPTMIELMREWYLKHV